MRGVAMVAILSSHQQNAMVSALNVLLLTLNKALHQQNAMVSSRQSKSYGEINI